MMAGKRDRRVTLLSPSKAQDAAGQTKVTYASAGDVWAQKIPLRGGEGFKASQRYAEATDRFLILHRTDVTPEWRIRYDGRDYEIVAVLEVGRRKGLDVYTQVRAE